MLNDFSRNPVAAIAEREAGWLLLASLLGSMPKEVLEILCNVCKTGTYLIAMTLSIIYGPACRSWKTRSLMFFCYGLVLLLEILNRTFVIYRIGHQNCGEFHRLWMDCICNIACFYEQYLFLYLGCHTRLIQTILIFFELMVVSNFLVYPMKGSVSRNRGAYCLHKKFCLSNCHNCRWRNLS